MDFLTQGIGHNLLNFFCDVQNLSILVIVVRPSLGTTFWVVSLGSLPYQFMTVFLNDWKFWEAIKCVILPTFVLLSQLMHA